LTLTQLKLSGGTAGSGGAMLSDSAALTLNGCVFDDNVATDGDGGAVRADGGNVTILGGGFLGNNASQYGGAVRAAGASSNVTDSVFDGNTAQLSGGALLGGNGTDITVNGCKFDNNTVMEYGGEIAASSMTFGGNTQLSNNWADGNGGAV
ncbi:unnamed protein product, partial [Laminaria digitata]